MLNKLLKLDKTCPKQNTLGTKTTQTRVQKEQKRAKKLVTKFEGRTEELKWLHQNLKELTKTESTTDIKYNQPVCVYVYVCICVCMCVYAHTLLTPLYLHQQCISRCTRLTMH